MVWQEDSMTKVFRYPLATSGPAMAPSTSAPASTSPAERQPITLHAARNEVVSAQFVVRAARDVDEFKCQTEPLAGPGEAKMAAPRTRYVGYVPVKKNSDDSAIRPAPADFPDPLLESPPPLKAGALQPVWVTIAVPKDAAPGDYAGKVSFTAGTASAELPIKLTVYSAVLGDERTLRVTNWTCFQPTMDKLYGFPCNLAEERYWELLAAFAKNMAQHRQNAILTPVRDLVKVTAGADGKMVFDFARLDRWVTMFADAGVLAPPRRGIIEGGHLADGKYDQKDHTSLFWTVKDGKAVQERISSWSDEHKQYLKAYLPALQSHLEAKGWLAMYRQHVFDEPTAANREQYRELAGIAREAAPKLKIMEANHFSAFVGLIDAWVPQTDHMARKMDFYDERRKAGDELWFYTCLNPRKPHLNRFIDYPLLKTRLLHWANFKYGVGGYLHWGWCTWPADPFRNVELDNLPPGDCHIVYPKPGGVLDSIRHETMLEGIQDYELLAALAARDGDVAKAICDSVLQDWTHYTLDVDAFRAARKKLLEALSSQ